MHNSEPRSLVMVYYKKDKDSLEKTSAKLTSAFQNECGTQFLTSVCQSAVVQYLQGLWSKPDMNWSC